MAPISTNCIPIILKSQVHKRHRGRKNRIHFHGKVSHYFVKEVLHSFIFSEELCPSKKYSSSQREQAYQEISAYNNVTQTRQILMLLLVFIG